jgi:hypothetical protein
MENSENVKRKYKKHKEGFKIAIEYKLNTKLKGQNFNRQFPLYPLYVEVRAKGKRNYFPSIGNFSVNPSEFEAFKNNEFVRNLLAKESEDIMNCIESEYAEPKDVDYKGWFETYRGNLLNETIFEKLRIRLREKLEPTLLQTETGKDVIYFGLDAKINFVRKTLEMIVTSMTPWSLCPAVQEGADILRCYLRMSYFLSLYSKVWFSPNLHILFEADQGPSFNLFVDNQFLTNMIKTFKHSDIFFQDLEEIQRYIEK